MAEYAPLLAAADFIEALGEAPIPIPYLAVGTLLAADALRMFVTLASLGHPPDDAAALVRRAISDSEPIKAAIAARDAALESALKGG